MLANVPPRVRCLRSAQTTPQFMGVHYVIDNLFVVIVTGVVPRGGRIAIRQVARYGREVLAGVNHILALLHRRLVRAGQLLARVRALEPNPRNGRSYQGTDGF